VLLVTAQFGPWFIGKPLSTLALGGDAAAWEGAGDNNILYKAIGEGDDVLYVNSDNGECGTVAATS
jgi:hypothetical protein